MSCALSSHMNHPVPFHENLGLIGPSSSFGLHHHHHHHHQPFPRENFLHGKSPRLISASWETLERLPRMSPPTSESITTHLLSSSSSSTSAASAAAAAAAASYLDSVLYKVICTPEFLKSAKENYIQPMLDTEFNQIVLPVECGKNCAFMYLTRLCQGSKGPCILFNACYWLTPNEFQSISGRNSAKDWKRSIRHNGKSIKLLINKGILTVHSPLCDCAYGSGIEPFVEKYATSSSPPIISSPSLDTQSPIYGVMDSECSHSDGTGGGSEEDPDHEEKFSPCTSEGCMTNGKEGKNTRDLEKEVGSSSSSSSPFEPYVTTAALGESSAEELDVSHFALLHHKAAESQGEESSSLSVSNNKGSSNSNGESQSERGTTTTTTTSSSSISGSQSQSGVVVTSTPSKSKRKPSTKQIHQHKPSSSSEQQSPTHLSSTTSSPPMTPPPPSLSSSTLLSSSSSSSQREREAGGQQSLGNSSNNNNHTHNNSSGGSSPPQQPIKQMEQMMTASSRNYSEFMRSLAAKYNQQQSNHNNDYFPNLSFDTRFLKPAAAAAFLNLSQLPSPVLLEKDKFPLIDMSSTQTLLSMVRSASAAAAAAAVTNNNNNNNINNNHSASNECFKSGSGGGGTKRPNSPLDLSSRDNIVHPLKKTKLKTPIDLMLSAKQATLGGTGAGAVCMSSCATGCSEEAQAMINWNVEEVCQFVATIDLCKDYVEIFRENSIDGSALPLLTEEHLMTGMNMKLGPALKFRSTVAKRLGNCVICSHCTHCHNHNNN